MKPKTIIYTLLFLIFVKVEGQTIMQEDFSAGLPESWDIGGKVELGHLIGVEQSDYVRFHPRFKQEAMISPELDMQTGYYRLHYTWMENGAENPDSVVIFLSKGGAPWQRLGVIGGGTQRNWIRDSLEIGSPESATCRLKFVYNGQGKFPATYINLDDIHVDIVSPPTGIRNNTLQADIQIFPNPTSEKIGINIQNIQSKNLNYQLLTLDGKILSETTISEAVSEWKGTLDLAAYANGIYFIRFYSGNEEKTLQFIISK